MKQRKKIITLEKTDDWKKVVAFVIPRLQSGTIVTLSGPLGAGKTTFVQHLAHALGIKSHLRSPTFSLVRSYRLPATSLHAYQPTRLLHVDAYRIEDESDLVPLNLEEELAETGTIMALEWPEQVSGWLKKQKNRKIQISIKIDSSDSRLVVIK